MAFARKRRARRRLWMVARKRRARRRSMQCCSAGRLGGQPDTTDTTTDPDTSATDISTTTTVPGTSGTNAADPRAPTTTTTVSGTYHLHSECAAAHNRRWPASSRPGALHRWSARRGRAALLGSGEGQALPCPCQRKGSLPLVWQLCGQWAHPWQTSPKKDDLMAGGGTNGMGGTSGG